jgi:hypothetical protein
VSWWLKTATGGLGGRVRLGTLESAARIDAWLEEAEKAAACSQAEAPVETQSASAAAAAAAGSDGSTSHGSSPPEDEAQMGAASSMSICARSDDGGGGSGDGATHDQGDGSEDCGNHDDDDRAGEGGAMGRGRAMMRRMMMHLGGLQETGTVVTCPAKGRAPLTPIRCRRRNLAAMEQKPTC